MLKKMALITIVLYSISTQTMDEPTTKSISDYISNPRMTLWENKAYTFGMEYVEGIKDEDSIEVVMLHNTLLHILHKRYIRKSIPQTGIHYREFREISTEIHLPFSASNELILSKDKKKIIIQGPLLSIHSPLEINPSTFSESIEVRSQSKHAPLGLNMGDAILTIAIKNGKVI